MQKPRTIIVTAAALACALLASCSKPEPAKETAKGAEQGKKAKKTITVGFAQTGNESDWRRANTESVKSEAEKRGINLKFADAQSKQENQIKAIRSFIAQGVDIVVIAPIVSTGWDPVLKEAKAARIPVILSDRRIDTADPSLYVTFIGSDFVKEGKMAAEWLVKKMNGKARIVELQGEPGSAPATDRRVGFLEVIKGSPGMEIIDSQSGDFLRAKGKVVMEAFLRKHGKNIQALFAHNDDMAIGAIQAIEEAGLKPGEDIIIVSIDAVKSAFEMMIAGKLNCTVECNPLLGPMIFDAVEAVMAGKQLPKNTYMVDEVFDQSKAKDVIASRKY
jgi:simple sugar transport system substrate-binding protein